MTQDERPLPPGLSIDLCTSQDRMEQARLFNAVFKKAVDHKALGWRYDENPHGGAISLLARPDDEDGVCGYACSPRIFVPHGEEEHAAPVGETGDVMTHPSWRKMGIFSKLDRAAMEESERLGWPCVFGLPNRHSAHIFLKLGWEQVGTIRHWTHLFRSDEAAKAERYREGRIAKWVTSFVARRARRTRRTLRQRATDAYEVQPITRFEEDAAKLCAEVAKRHALMVRRDADYLNWRYLKNPSRLHRALGIYRPGSGELQGFVVIQVPRRGESKGWLVDLVAADETASAAAMEAGLEALEKSGASLAQANAVDHSPWQRDLERAGFVPPKPENHLIVILYTHQADHPVAVAARDASAWFLTDGDRDDETVG
ncbi:MAG: GNAT family N-acetyltransferase [Planctomycetota bacterium]